MIQNDWNIVNNEVIEDWKLTNIQQNLMEGKKLKIK